MDTNHDKDMQEGKKTYLVEDYKSAMYDISRFANEGADLLGKGPDGGAEDPKDSKDANKGEKKAGPDGGGVQETKEGPEEA